MSTHRRLTLRGAALALLVTAVSGVAASAAPAPGRPSAVTAAGGAIGEGASDVNAFFSGGVRGIVHAAVLADGSVRVRSVVRGEDPARSYRLVASSTPCGQPAAGKLVLLTAAPIMGRLVAHTFPAGALPDRTGLLASVRIVRSTGGQVACAAALSYQPATTVAGPALMLTDLMVSSFMSPNRPRGLLVTTRPDTTEPSIHWSLTGLSGVTSFRIVGSTAACGTASTPANQAFRSALQTKPYGFTEVTGLDIQVESFRIVAKSGQQLACTGRGRHIVPLL